MAPLPYCHGRLSSLRLNEHLLSRSNIVRRSEDSGAIIGGIFGAVVFVVMLGFIIHLLTRRPSPPKKCKKGKDGKGSKKKKKPKKPQSNERPENCEDDESPSGSPFAYWAGFNPQPGAGGPRPPGRGYNGGDGPMDAPPMECSYDEPDYGFDRRAPNMYVTASFFAFLSWWCFISRCISWRASNSLA
ncbi:uncharacterized protein F5Z01DRAFT_675652 [Emericellopsis atlantica]|uniref:Uncharacterized protein n=1 Tax=Emericellopsis atlantica TaxID=2614577 RepID=A0A9P7ZIR9_9HYPO|nr:uncharacterized protein F5Z01DRAFT_675652 [Emericellopsis atlantica]KAG9252849.1 hypothetical protein F5Z01DRAFT_675652 [Emericellopsis atlantica]